MINPPKTKQQARKYKYNKWAGNSKGNKYNETKCAYEVKDKFMWGGRQCFRTSGYGHDRLYCKQHAYFVHQYYTDKKKRYNRGG